MSHEEAVSFIKNAIISDQPQNWADLGCGSGTFTKALADLLPPGSRITAVDKDKQRLDMENVDFIRANFEKDELKLAGLDGILIANAIHYVPDKTKLIRKLETMFAGSPRFVIIEYDTDRRNLWVPYPINFEKLQAFFGGLGYRNIVKVNERRSAYNSGNMYCAVVSLNGSI